MSLSFRLRIALWSALLSGIVLLVFLGVTSNMVRKTMTEEADFELKTFTAVSYTHLTLPTKRIV